MNYNPIAIPTDLTPEAALQLATDWEQAAYQLRQQTWDKYLQPFFATLAQALAATPGFYCVAPIPTYYLGFNYRGHLYYLCAYPGLDNLDLQDGEGSGQVIATWDLSNVALPDVVVAQLPALVSSITEALNA